MALRYWRPVGLVLMPFTIGLILAVVYGQFHYADLGGVIGLVGVLVDQAVGRQVVDGALEHRRTALLVGGQADQRRQAGV
jgi:hypothetical protein